MLRTEISKNGKGGMNPETFLRINRFFGYGEGSTKKMEVGKRMKMIAGPN